MGITDLSPILYTYSSLSTVTGSYRREYRPIRNPYYSQSTALLACHIQSIDGPASLPYLIPQSTALPAYHIQLIDGPASLPYHRQTDSAAMPTITILIAPIRLRSTDQTIVPVRLRSTNRMIVPVRLRSTDRMIVPVRLRLADRLVDKLYA